MHCRILSRKQGKASSPTSPIMSQPNPFFRPPVFLSDVTDINCKIHFDLHSCFLCVMWGSVDCWAQPNYFRAAFSRYNQVAIRRNILYIPLSTAKHSIATEASIGVLLYSVFSILVEYIGSPLRHIGLQFQPAQKRRTTVITLYHHQDSSQLTTLIAFLALRQRN